MIILVLEILKEKLGITEDDKLIGKWIILAGLVKEAYDERKKKKERGEEVYFDFREL